MQDSPKVSGAAQDIQPLAARLEAATEGSRELSDAVLEAAGWERWNHSVGAKFETRADGDLVCVDPGTPYAGFASPEGRLYRSPAIPDPTRDLNAIVAMVEAAGWYVRIVSDRRLDGFGWYAELADPALASQLGKRGTAATLALALSAALVRALTHE